MATPCVTIYRFRAFKGSYIHIWLHIAFLIVSVIVIVKSMYGPLRHFALWLLSPSLLPYRCCRRCCLIAVAVAVALSLSPSLSYSVLTRSAFRSAASSLHLCFPLLTRSAFCIVACSSSSFSHCCLVPCSCNLLRTCMINLPVAFGQNNDTCTNKYSNMGHTAVVVAVVFTLVSHRFISSVSVAQYVALCS